MIQRLTIVCICLFIQTIALAQTGIRGTIKTKGGDPLPYAAIAVKGTQNGTISNAEGRYELTLAPGKHQLLFQYLGFQSQQKAVEIDNGFINLDIVLEEQVYNLQEVNAKSSNEDPAYTIMRRAIAKAKFHQLQVQSYTARVYTKASVTVTELPMEFLYKKQLKEAETEANFKKGVPILNESVSEVTFKQPNTYREHVIANRNTQGVKVAVNGFYQSSFYQPEVANVVSPLSPKAFAYYKFEYEGTFREQGVDISRINVIPRSYGEGVFRGFIYIIENTWAIHSLQLETHIPPGINLSIKQIYNPVRNVWMPTNQRFDAKGSFYGAKFTGQYVINLTYKDFTINPAFVEEVQVIDEKIDKPANVLANRDIKGKKLDELVAKQKEFSTKNLRKMVREYEKQEYKERKEKKEDVAVTRNDSVSIDTMAYKRANSFWDSLRSVPLTTAELKSYVRSDSVRIVREVKAKTDSVKKENPGMKNPNRKHKFSPFDLVTGNTWRLSKTTSLQWSDILTSVNYNTVEGYHATAGLQLNYHRLRVDSTKARQVNGKTVYPYAATPNWYIGGNARYQLGREQVVGYGKAGYAFKTTNVDLTGGRFMSQLNPENPISPQMNSFTTLLFERNLMKLYQKDFIQLSVSAKPMEGRLKLNGSLEYANRTEVANYRENLKPWIDWKNYAYTPNRVPNNEIGTTAFPNHEALVLNLSATMRLASPHYYIRNGRKITRTNRDAPELTVNYRRSFGSLLNSNASNYDFLQARIGHSFETGIRSRLSYDVSAGAFLTSQKVYAPDFKHFMGNEFFLQQGDPVSVFRMLPYYQYSTGKRFFEAHVLSEHRKFLITQLTMARLVGLKENLFVHYLATPRSPQYTEVGYGLDGLIPGVLPFFRVEVISQWENTTYKGLGFRVGTTLKFGRN
ncbi:DUF5686 and carboxypeptidase regulatory-like domain-containing protein [Arsenicibacter rosenii]|uniref:DUF5686 and carboxypeptidase regulatory-like domain-containing protein n=1 Tax=Arsenicibacter rosenii TaxID=1750698 RepID=UPI0009F2F556|nr:DUF5686 and carboxypeptidase regulatory-like domain-containing protein [Arsenicibacter rosenii]